MASYFSSKTFEFQRLLVGPKISTTTVGAELSAFGLICCGTNSALSSLVGRHHLSFRLDLKPSFLRWKVGTADPEPHTFSYAALVWDDWGRVRTYNGFLFTFFSAHLSSEWSVPFMVLYLVFFSKLLQREFASSQLPLLK